WHTSPSLLACATGRALTATLVSALREQPFASVTVTAYTPAISGVTLLDTVGLRSVEVNPAGPVHRKASCGGPGVTVASTSDDPSQTGLLLEAGGVSAPCRASHVSPIPSSSESSCAEFWVPGQLSKRSSQPSPSVS